MATVIGESFRTNGNEEKALTYFLKSIKLDSTNASNYLNATYCCMNLERIGEAKEFADKFVQHAKPNDPRLPGVRKLLEHF